MEHILIIDDDRSLLGLLQNCMQGIYEADTAWNGKQGLAMLSQAKYDLVLLDVMLPGENGFDVLEKIRKQYAVPVIMLTALGSEKHQMRGYEMQIDEFVTKPVSMPLLIQKVEAVLRRTMKQEQCLCFAKLVLDVKGHKVTAAGDAVELTLREFEILRELMEHGGEVVERKSLVTKLWGYDGCDETRIVDTHMKNLRKKLAGCDYIDTVRGVGYRLKLPDGSKE